MHIARLLRPFAAVGTLFAGVVLTSLAHANLINPRFNTGDLTGWEVYDVCYGGKTDCGQIDAQVITPDTWGTRTPFDSSALRLTVGTSERGYTDARLPIMGGGGVRNRTLELAESRGRLDVSVDIAICDWLSPSEPCDYSDNQDVGYVRLIVGGRVLDAWSADFLGSTERMTTLSGSIDTGGLEEDELYVALEAVRRFNMTDRPSGIATVQWFDNLILSGPATLIRRMPEPSGVALLLLGALTLAFGASRRV